MPKQKHSKVDIRLSWFHDIQKM